MSCKQCGTNWKNELGNQELLDELRVREITAQQARKEFFAHEWPNADRWSDSIIIVPMCVVFFGIALGSPQFMKFFGFGLPSPSDSASVFAALVMMIIVFILMFAVSAYVSVRRNRLQKQFFAKYPEESILAKNRAIPVLVL